LYSIAFFQSEFCQYVPHAEFFSGKTENLPGSM